MAKVNVRCDKMAKKLKKDLPANVRCPSIVPQKTANAMSVVQESYSSSPPAWA
jgi:hypothetical protein